MQQGRFEMRNRKASNVENFGDLLDLYVRQITPTKRRSVDERSQVNGIRFDAVTERLCDCGRGGEGFRHHDPSRSVTSGGTRPCHCGPLRGDALLLLRDGPEGLGSSATTPSELRGGLAYPMSVRAARQVRSSTASSARRARKICWLLTFLVETAVRRSEALSLRWGDVHPNSRFARVNETKNRANRDVPLSPRAVRLCSMCCGDAMGASSDSLPTARLRLAGTVERAG